MRMVAFSFRARGALTTQGPFTGSVRKALGRPPLQPMSLRWQPIAIASRSVFDVELEGPKHRRDWRGAHRQVVFSLAH